MTEPTRCDGYREGLAEVATGAASGPDRARTLAHLAGCEDCRRELDALARVADEVLLVAPQHQPPAGFESAVLDRIRVEDGSRNPRRAKRKAPAGRRHRVLRPLAAVAAALVIAVAAAGTVWTATAQDRETADRYERTLAVADGRYFTAAPVLDGGVQVGHVFLYQGEPSWVFAVLGEAAPGTYDLVVSTGEWTATVGSCEVAETSCGTGATVAADIGDITEVRLVGSDGTVLTAALPGW
ncbi:hypothetical protein [Glycomyces paridis]|uniref:Zf-HC2 domain-containing protein n=1 Tax=Glycomyces paridis TaxID=2126555 RepID=A0A4V4HN39_9ACTN|nr:hypothetical protein [Glycomyces paridis]THV24566.1 hypothetical protein E9998_20375 [Glycomyces paridis]